MKKLHRCHPIATSRDLTDVIHVVLETNRRWIDPWLGSGRVGFMRRKLSEQTIDQRM